MCYFVLAKIVFFQRSSMSKQDEDVLVRYQPDLITADDPLARELLAIDCNLRRVQLENTRKLAERLGLAGLKKKLDYELAALKDGTAQIQSMSREEETIWRGWLNLRINDGCIRTYKGNIPDLILEKWLRWKNLFSEFEIWLNHQGHIALIGFREKAPYLLAFWSTAGEFPEFSEILRRLRRKIWKRGLSGLAIPVICGLSASSLWPRHTFSGGADLFAFVLLAAGTIISSAVAIDWWTGGYVFRSERDYRTWNHCSRIKILLACRRLKKRLF